MKRKTLFILLVMLVFWANDSRAQKMKALGDSLMYYYNKGLYIKSIVFAEEMVNETSKLLVTDEENMRYAEAVATLATLNTMAGNYGTALSLHESASNIRKKIFGESSIEYAASLQELAALYIELGKNVEAEPLFLKVLAIRKKVLGINNVDYAYTLSYLAYTYKALGNYAKAIPMYQEAMGIQKSISGEMDGDYAESLNNLAVLYQITGNYSTCEELLLQSLSIKKKSVGENHPKYANSLANLAALYSAMGNYAAALNLYLQSLEIKKRTIGEEHQDYIKTVETIAATYERMGNYADAEPLYIKAIATNKKVLGLISPVTATSINSLARLYQSMGNLNASYALCREALDIYQNSLGQNHPLYAGSLSTLANYYFLKGTYDTAKVLMLQEMAIRKNVIGENNLDYIFSQLKLTNLLIASKDFLAAANLQIAAQLLEKEQLLNKLDYLSQSELLSYLKERAGSFVLPFYLLQHQSFSQLIKVAYNNRLLLTGIGIQNSSSLSKQMEQSKDSLVASIWANYKSNKFLLSKTLALPIAKRTVNVDSLTNIANQQEKKLLRISAEYRNMKGKLNITWKEVQSHLKPNEAAIEFVQFKQYQNARNLIDTTYYAAMLLRPQDTVPLFIKLFEERQLIEAMNNFVYKAALQSRGASANNKAVELKPAKKGTYNLIWKPLQPYLKSTKTIYFSPDGLLHQLAFAAMPYGKESLLCDRYNLVQVTSTRQVALKDSNMLFPKSIALFGGINYDKQQTDTINETLADPYAYVYQQNRNTDFDSFSYLPGTLKEVEAIKRSMQLKQSKVTLFSGNKATEAAFRNLSGAASPQVIHFATHGFTLPDRVKDKVNNNTFKISDNPLLRAGLVMAGGNRGWKGKNQSNEDDGILTGLEISNMLLPNTKLAVLSACETGIGELKGSEGIFGLQRAFKLAGVNYIMASLWQVPDKETSEFMKQFYTQWLAGNSIQESFNETQKIMRKKYAPYYWAGFTLVH